MVVVVSLLAAAGILISAYVWRKQVTTGPVLCLGDGCAKVIRSPYGRLLGVPNGALGVAYFLAVSVLSMLAPRAPEIWTALAAASAAAVALYAYLTYLQAAVLRAWCVWCLSSAALAVAILVTALRARA